MNHVVFSAECRVPILGMNLQDAFETAYAACVYIYNTSLLGYLVGALFVDFPPPVGLHA
jgi:hypothetical protein